MSFQDVLNTATRAAGALDGVVSAAGQLTDALGLGGATFWDQLRPASYRGIPFAVLASDGEFGRRLAEHEYPNRDVLWVEDMGRRGRRINVIGFLVGDDVISQMQQMIAAAEQEGRGELVHPTLGTLYVSLGPMRVSERWDQGRYVELSMQFVESGDREFPDEQQDTSSWLSNLADEAGLSVEADFVAGLIGQVKQGVAVVQSVVSTAAEWASRINQVVSAAKGIYNAVAGITGQLQALDSFANRYGDPRGVAAPSSPTPSPTRRAVAASAVQRQAVTASAAAVSAAAGQLGAQAAAIQPLPAAVSQSVAALVAASASPMDAINALTALSQLPMPQGVDTSPMGVAMTTAQQQTVAMMRRAAVIGVCRAVSAYQPTSYDDAASLRSRVSQLVEREAVAAADAGSMASYQALRDLRTAVVADLTARGGSLARMMPVSIPQPMPSMVLAQRLYRDPSRAGELAQQAGAIHPLFMPTQFNALAQ
ncbi:DNA circularization protein [Chromobacterium vaccinii]|uniref:DNA circularization protein n=1 Tax=Chromobacterium vaccinii TaxID=1108595 RepID=UPI003C7363E6